MASQPIVAPGVLQLAIWIVERLIDCAPTGLEGAGSEDQIDATTI